MIEVKYADNDIIVCIKPGGVLSTDGPGGLPGLLREQLGGDVRTVHRLDQVVGGLMVLARSPEAARVLSSQIAERSFGKEYLAVLHGCPTAEYGTLTDLLGRNKPRRITYVATEPGKDVREAVLDYRVLANREGISLVHIQLRTGRTHQIRAQFSSRGMPLVGDRKYGDLEEFGGIALWSCRLSFLHPLTGAAMDFSALPTDNPPWTVFDSELRQAGDLDAILGRHLPLNNSHPPCYGN